MIAKVGEARKIELLSGTYSGVQIHAYMKAAAVNTTLAQADFNPSSVAVKVTLMRGKQNYIIMQDNLLLLGTYSCFTHAYHEFINGIDKVYKDTSVKQIKLRASFLDFGGSIRVGAGELLTIEIIPAQTGTFSANVDDTASYLEFDAVASIGYMSFIPMITTKVIQAGATKEPFSPGDNVKRLVLLNFDQNNLTNEVVSSITLGSDRLDTTWTFNQLQSLKARAYGASPAYRYGTALPVTTTPTVFRGLDYHPQSYELFNGLVDNTELDRVKVDVSFNVANVAASNNYIVWTSYVTDEALLSEALNRQNKHTKEYIKKVTGAPALPVK